MQSQPEWTYGSHVKVMPTSFKRITGEPTVPHLPLYSVDALRSAEKTAAAVLGHHALMQRAGLAIAQFALAMAPHARKIWIPCGPGNNGGDGLEAAIHLQRWGKNPVVSLLHPDVAPPEDARRALHRAQQAGVIFEVDTPTDWDLCIDALFGIGIGRPLDDKCVKWIQDINRHDVGVLAVDVPTGIHPHAGRGDRDFVRADATLTLLGGKTGLFTGDGRDASGEIWLNTLDIEIASEPCAFLNAGISRPGRLHNSHKGSYGDVAIVGGCQGMTGAGILAGLGALHGGAGRVYLCLLGEQAPAELPEVPELMLRKATTLDLSGLTVVAGCGGGAAIQSNLPDLLSNAKKLVLDADALNAIAKSSELATLVKKRAPHTTIATPHPLEAARLLNTDTLTVQNERLQAAQSLSNLLACTVILKGSGSVITSPDKLPSINMTGSARLATGGTGDVLAGLAGAILAAGVPAHEAACSAAYLHGQTADKLGHHRHLTASELARAL